MSKANSRNELSKVWQESDTIRVERSGVGGSKPSHRTNLPATMTPKWLARDMAVLLDAEPYDDVLEPSAGTGALIEACRNGYITAIELNRTLFENLPLYLVKTSICADFLRHNFGDKRFERIIMNPPHKNCVAHIERSISLLTDDGRIVALIHSVYEPEVIKFMPDVRFYRLPVDTFAMNGVAIEATVLVWDKELIDE